MESMKGQAKGPMGEARSSLVKLKVKAGQGFAVVFQGSLLMYIQIHMYIVLLY